MTHNQSITLRVLKISENKAWTAKELQRTMHGVDSSQYQDAYAAWRTASERARSYFNSLSIGGR